MPALTCENSQTQSASLRTVSFPPVSSNQGIGPLAHLFGMGLWTGVRKCGGLSLALLGAVQGVPVELAGLKALHPPGRREGAEPCAREAPEPGNPPARLLSRSPSRQHLGRAGGGAAALRWQKRVETWRQVTERGARWGLGNQPRVAGDPRPLAVSLAPPAEPPVSGGIHPVTGSGTWPR